MISKSRDLLLFGTTALCLAVVLPTMVADGRLTHGMRDFGDLSAALRESFDLRPSDTSAPSSVEVADKTAGATLEAAESRPGPEPVDIAPPAETSTASPAINVGDRIRSLGYDPVGIVEAIAAYHAANLDGGDAIAARVTHPLVRTALEWVALRQVPQKVGTTRLVAFAASHSRWPAKTWLRTQLEARQLGVRNPTAVATFFSDSAPETPLGKLALARSLKATGRVADGTRLARAVFRESNLNGYAEALIKGEFGGDLTKSDYKYRADRYVYDEKIAQALRFAALAGPDAVALTKARAAVIAQGPSDKAMGAVPAGLRKDPVFILSEVQRLRRTGKLIEAARLMESAPHDAVALIDGDEWWVERRVLARKLLDAHKINAAYIMCAMNSAVSTEARIEAQFHAGWIALRFMHDPSRATYHFNVAAKLAKTPASIARIAYWQARTAEASTDPAAAASTKALYEKAAAQGATYYGQLARQVIGHTGDPIQKPAYIAVGDDREEAVRVIELLYASGDKESAYALAVSAASNLDDPAQVGALAAVIGSQQDAHLSLTIGKLAAQRGMPVDALAFPTFGIPAYDALQNSAPPAVVYSVARQESTFIPTVVSKAGAKGLMQMIDATAKHTAVKAGLPFDSTRLLNDASFNAQLGAAHLGELMAEQGGSLILTFAAYNAGGGRVKEWIDAYGDPRKPGVDPVDWIERIPFTETRNYVQKVMANVTMYEALFADKAKAVATRGAREAKL